MLLSGCMVGLVSSLIPIRTDVLYPSMRLPAIPLFGQSVFSSRLFGLSCPGFSNLIICSTNYPGCHAPLVASFLEAGVMFLYPAAKPWHKILKLCYRHLWIW